MLQTLDPHSSFLDPRAYAQMRERQEGRYYGLGISISPIDGDITVMSPVRRLPAYKKGIRRGDVIARIEGQDTKGWTSDQAVKLLRGTEGHAREDRRSAARATTSSSSCGRARRGQHPDAQGRVHGRRPETGYIRLNDFSETTDRDLGEALDRPERQGHEAPPARPARQPRRPARSGHQGVRTASCPRATWSSTRAAASRNSDQDYRASEPGDFGTMPVVVLVNRNSASASEIVSGALQDHDRALIVGEKTFGKALVQSVYRISEGAGLALTTARYFTPSGRLIQRPWDGTFDEYLTYSLREQKADEPHDPANLKLTDAGRKVYGGGGIQPDKYIAGPVEGFNPSRFGRALWARQIFADYAARYHGRGRHPHQGQRPDAHRQSRGSSWTMRWWPTSGRTSNRGRCGSTKPPSRPTASSSGP